MVAAPRKHLDVGNHFGEVLRDAGYHTGYIGKWHLHGGLRGRPIPAGSLRYGFDHEFFSNNGTLQFGAGDAFFWDEKGERVKLGKWQPDGRADQALAFIDRHAGNEQPFALFVSWHPPHNWSRGYPAPPEYEKLYDPGKIKLRPSCADTRKSRAEYPGYMAICTNLDDNFGRLLKRIDEKGIRDNTLVVYTSDHGDLLRSHGIHDWHKSRPEHASCRVPLILRWPGKLPPRVSDMLIGTLDLMPTLSGLLGIEPPETCQGSNYADALMEGRDRATKSVPPPRTQPSSNESLWNEIRKWLRGQDLAIPIPFGRAKNERNRSRKIVARSTDWRSQTVNPESDFREVSNELIAVGLTAKESAR